MRNVTKLFWIILLLNFVLIADLEAGDEKTAEFIPDSALFLKDKEKLELLKISRKTLESVVKKNVFPDFNQDELNFSLNFKENFGVFVTLKRGEYLRGCIGNIVPHQMLVESVIHNTANSALFDRRFVPVVPGELDDIEIEISVLSKIKIIPGYNYFEIGKHGIIINKDKASAVFLPQVVATEQNWSRGETLSHLCTKAGLPEDAWKDSDMEFSVFTDVVFNESKFLAQLNSK